MNGETDTFGVGTHIERATNTKIGEEREASRMVVVTMAEDYGIETVKRGGVAKIGVQGFGVLTCVKKEVAGRAPIGRLDMGKDGEPMLGSAGREGGVENVVDKQVETDHRRSLRRKKRASRMLRMSDAPTTMKKA